MFSDLKPYPDYRESGSRMLGLVPSGWAVRPMRTFLTARTGRNRPDLPLLSVARERGAFVRGADDDNHNVIPEDLTGYKIALAGDLVINKMKAWQGSLGLAPCDGIVSPAYYVFEFAMSNRYFGQALLRSRPYVGEFAAASDGVRIGQWDLSVSRLRKVPVVVPPSDEQAAIVKYLGHANARIDRAIVAKRKLIALLEEQKQAVINQAVTHGLDPVVPMKDSGIPWLGEIPDHWQVWPMGRLARVGNGSTPSRTTPEFWQDGNYPWLNSSFANKREVLEADQFVTTRALAECHLPIVPPGSVIVAITGQGKTRGKAALLKMEATINQHLAYLTPDPRRSGGPFLQAVLVAAYPELRRISDDSGSTKGALTCQDLKVFRVPVASLVEQEQIVQWIHDETNTTEAAADRAAREIELLREFRTRLTADVVTGQLDIRDAAALLPELDPADLVSDVVEQDEDDLEAELAASLEEVDA